MSTCSMPQQKAHGVDDAGGARVADGDGVVAVPRARCVDAGVVEIIGGGQGPGGDGLFVGVAEGKSQ